MKKMWRILSGDNEHPARGDVAEGLSMDSRRAARLELLPRTNNAASGDTPGRQAGFERKAPGAAVALRKELQGCKQALRDLAVELTVAEERERHRIALALHDHVCQDLSAATLMVGLLTGSAPSERPRERLAEIERLLVQVGASLRSLTFELCPPVLYERGLEAALAWLVDRFRRRTAIGIRLVSDGRCELRDTARRTLLFQVAGELLTNVVKHARATRAVVTVAKTPRGVSLAVEDDGVGFDPVAPRPRPDEDRSFGLFSIRRRLSCLGGHLEIDSEPGRGSRLAVVVPD